MSLEFRFRVAMLRVKVKLALLLLAQFFVADQWVIMASVLFPLLSGIYWIVADSFQAPTILYCAVVAIRLSVRIFSNAPEFKVDQPLFGMPGAQARLAETLEVLRREFGAPKYQRTAFPLSSVPWRRYSCSCEELLDQSGVAVVAIGFLEIYSVLDLKCDLAHALVRERSRWIVRACERSVPLVERMARSYQRRWWALLAERVLHALQARLLEWNLLADMLADVRIAAKYGPVAVGSWVERSQLAKYSVSECVANRIAPLTREGVLLPIAETCRFYHLQLEGKWLDSLRELRIEAKRNPGTMDHPVLIRLAALEGVPAGMAQDDPRPAAALFVDLPALEESVIKHELTELADVKLRRPVTGELAATVILPLMREELQRNADLVATWTIKDLPALVKDKKSLAERYRTEPRILLASTQREALMPGFITSFLTVELVNSGWVASYAPGDGVRVARGEKSLRPAEIVDKLFRGDVNEEELEKLVDRGS